MSEYRVDETGIAMLGGLSAEGFEREAGAAIADPAVHGVIVVAGSGLATQPYPADVRGLGKLLRRIETSGKPFVAAIAGTAAGVDYEICLACHHRVAADDPGTRIGLSDVQAGLMPGLGGTQRLPRLIGIQRALPL